MSKSADAITVVIPVHNMPERLDNIVPAWGVVLEKTGRDFQILVVDDGSTDNTNEIAAKLAARVKHARVLKHHGRKGYGACLKTALAETKTPLFFYTAVDYPYTPSDIRVFFERIELKDELLLKQPDLITGCRSGLQTPEFVIWIGTAWKLFWRICAGLPITERTPWLGWREFWFSFRVHFTYAVPLVDVNSCFKLFRTSFLKKFPIQSDGDFVHTELVAKATFLTSIMDEVPLTPKPDPIPSMSSVRTDRRRVFQQPEFSFPPPPPAVASTTPATPSPEGPKPEIPGSSASSPPS
jgi:glycosyltransferase involved in cell wall biosynthesis